MASSIPALEFDFAPVLTSLDPYHTYSSTPLSGGFVNLTSRVTISPSTKEHECLFKETGPTVVAKYAPPYVASMGESAPFDTFRQVIEARALALLNDRSTLAYIHSQEHNVSVPTLIHHDTENHVLVMSDLGPESITLHHWLLSPHTQLEDAQKAGSRFGSFFAGLARVDPTALGLDFSNPDAQNMVLEIIVRGARENLCKCGIELAEADELARLLVESFETQNRLSEETVFSLGDCWPFSFLILDSRGEGLSVIDWEFAGMNFPLQDMAQLAARLYILYEISPSSKAIVKAFALSFFRTHYAEASGRHYSPLHRTYAWRLLGREIVNSVAEGKWFGDDQEKREVEMKRLGGIGAGFIKNATEIMEDALVRGAPPFEAFFLGLHEEP